MPTHVPDTAEYHSNLLDFLKKKQGINFASKSTLVGKV